MADTDSEFLIKIRTLLEDQGIKLTDDQVKNLEQSLGKAGKAMEGISGHETRHGIHLAADALQQISPQLGEIGRLAPLASAGLAFLAPAAVIEAVGMLSDQLKKVHDQLVENIKTGQQMRDMFEDNLRAATLHANEALAAYRDTLSHVHDQQDKLSQALASNTAELTVQTEATKSLAKAEEALADARIQSGVLAGATSGPMAARMEDEERRKARAAEEAAQRGQAEEEIAFKRATARTAESDAKQADIDAQKAIADKPRLEAAVKDSGDLLERAKNNLQGLEGNLAEAKANGFAGQAVPAIRVGMDKGELDRRNMIIAADEALKFAQGQVDRQKAVIEDQEKRHSQLTIEEAQNEGAIERLTRRAIEMGRLADETKRAADEEERLQAIRDRSQSNIDAKADETALVRRRNALQEKINSGTATPDEQSEYSGATDTGVSHRIADTQRRITDIQNNIRLEGGRASAQEVAALVKLNDYLVGLLENVHGVTNRNESDIQSLMSRVQSLEDHGHIDRMGR